MAVLLRPTEREMAEAAEIVADARATLLRLGARPIVDRLEAALAGDPVAASSAPVTAADPSTVAEARSV